MATKNVFTLKKPGSTNDAFKVEDVDGVSSLYVNGNKIEANALEGGISSVTIAYAASATTDGIEATYTFKDASGTAVSGIHTVQVYISDDADGNGLTATAASGTLTAATGTILTALTAKKHIIANTSSAGVLKLLLVDSANTVGERFCAVLPASGKITVGEATVATNYEGGV
jgi:hypothetical protein